MASKRIEAEKKVVMCAQDHLVLIASGLRRLHLMSDEEIQEYHMAIADSTPVLLELITHLHAVRTQERDAAQAEKVPV